MIAHPPEKTSSEPTTNELGDIGRDRNEFESKWQAPPPTANIQPSQSDIVTPTRHRSPSYVLPVLMIGIGVLFLLNTMNIVDWNVWGNIWRLWPLVLIAFGLEVLIGRRSLVASMIIAGMLLIGLLAGFWFWAEQPLSGKLITGDTVSQSMQGAQQANVSIDFSVGTFRLDALSSSDQLVSGQVSRFENETIRQDFHLTGDTAYYTLKTDSTWNFPFFNNDNGNRVWDLALNSQTPIDLKVSSGVGDSTLNLERLNLTGFNLSTGAGDTSLTLPVHGTFDATINAGVGNLNVDVPTGMGLHVTGDAGLGFREMPSSYIKTGKAYESPGYATSENHIDLNINAGVGNITVREVQPTTKALP